ncbi:hypothetical protein [Actinokineospora sp. NBRC 105648]|uniref:hypothetical protein n=1 Tax=Actinokineospora sp. NBRC 105648 TaxID=3032206 RepID=UPI0024A3F1C3|nr:hypothetical protein [Actinokineospora sp. NBRC 105648]GLZ40210.1 hypothetical protein Acsp05_38340 [Actinokineospora sp. NBRC 105648]
MASSQRRTGADACPGALDVHQAADGGLARVRVPGGQLTAEQLRVVVESAADLGNGVVELTSRANLQVRGLAPGTEVDLAARLAAVGLLPSLSHEKVRNIMASPLGPGDLVAELDELLRATPALAALPGRFLFALDDGTGDVAWLGADLTAVPVDPHHSRNSQSRTPAPSTLHPPTASTPHSASASDPASGPHPSVDGPHPTPGGQPTPILSGGGLGRGRDGLPVDRCGQLHAVLLGGVDLGIRVRREDTARVLVTLAGDFLRLRDGHWRIAELGPQVAEVAAAVGTSDARIAVGAPPTAGPMGPLVFADGSPGFGAVAPLGRITAAQAAVLGTVIITPWRGVVVRGDGRGLAEAGLLTEWGAPGIGVTACAGKPGCAKALADVRSAALAVDQPGRAVHWSGCGRRCGRPAGAVIDVVATADGYLLDGRAIPGGQVVGAVADRRQQ